ncbi:FAD-dependent oxidoreductase [Ensifer sp. NBAIM29]|nr:FAD-dependent oxidoreductase [Ensifer sp. NBAIM29]
MTLDPRYSVLFEPVKIGPVTAPNRFFAVPHATGHSPLMPNGSIAMRAMKAEGGWGTVAMQLAEIDPSSDISNLPIEKFWDETDIASHARLTARIREHGALSAIEIAHSGLRSRGLANGYPVLGPSSLPVLKPEVPVQAKAMDKEDIRSLRRSYRAAVQRAKEAGYDIVYVYAAHDASVLWHFLTPAYNFRTDEYGGNFENRVRLLREVLEETKEEARDEIAVAIRFAVHELSGPRAILSTGEGRDVVERLAELPDLWDVNVSGWSRDSGTSRFDPEGAQEEFTSFVKTVTSKPVVGVGRFTSPDAMVSQIRRGVLDLIGGARPSIADPFLPNKIKDGRVDEIRECIGCNICVASDAYSIPLRCTQNPTMSEEWRRGWHPERIPAAPEPKNLLVVGSGPAGLECAFTLARAGHQVTVADKSTELGGRVSKESRLKGLSAWSRVRDYRLYQLQQMANVDLYPESEATADDVADFGADHVFVATGSHWRDDGLGRSRYTAIQGFRGNALTPDHILDGGIIAGSVVVYDDDHYYMGNVLAEHLAALGSEVHLVCPLPSIAGWMGYTLEQPRVIAALMEAGVKMYPNTTAIGWEDGVLRIKRSDTYEELQPIRVDNLLTVTARLPNDALGQAIRKSGSVGCTVIGDAVAPGIIQSAVFSGHKAAREFLGTEPENRIFRRETPKLFV